MIRRIVDAIVRRWRDRRGVDTAWKPTGIRQTFPGFDHDLASKAARRRFDRYTTAESARVAREIHKPINGTPVSR